MAGGTSPHWRAEVGLGQSWGLRGKRELQATLCSGLRLRASPHTIRIFLAGQVGGPRLPKKEVRQCPDAGLGT